MPIGHTARADGDAANSINNGRSGGGGVVALIPRGEVIRNFVYSGALDEVAKHANLSLLSVMTASSVDDELRNRYGDVYPLDEQKERWAIRIQREILDIAHNRWLWSRAARERSRLRDAEAVTFVLKSKRTAKKLVSYPFANRVGLSLLEKAERTSSRWLRTTENHETLFRKLRPSLVFNGSHIHSRNAIQAVQTAQWLGIPTATFIFSWDNLTSQGRITLPYDYFLVWNEPLKCQLLEMYDWIKPENVFVTGTPQFDHHFQSKFYLSRESYCNRIGADPQRPLVLYTTGMANHMPGEPEIVEGIADILAEYRKEDRPQLMVRVYAKDLSGRFDELRKRRRDILFADPLWEPNWLTPTYDDSYELVNALRHCSLGINVASTISLELCMFDKPAINVGYNPPAVPAEELCYADYYEFDHYKPVVESGAVEVANDADEMRRLIHNSLSKPETRSYERKALINRMFGETLDGASGMRVANVLLNLAGN
jgi:hypothetical protein